MDWNTSENSHFPAFFKLLERLHEKRISIIEDYLNKLKVKLSENSENAQTIFYEYKGPIKLIQLVQFYDANITSRIITVLDVLNDVNLQLLVRQDTFVFMSKLINNPESSRETVFKSLNLIFKMVNMDAEAKVLCQDTKCLESIIKLFCISLNRIINPPESPEETRISSKSFWNMICTSLKHCVADNRINKAETSLIIPMTVDFLATCSFEITQDGDLVQSHFVTPLLMLLVDLLTDNTLCQLNFTLHNGLDVLTGILSICAKNPINCTETSLVTSAILSAVYVNSECGISVGDSIVHSLLNLLSYTKNMNCKLSLICCLHSIVAKDKDALQEFCKLNGNFIIASMRGTHSDNEDFLLIADKIINICNTFGKTSPSLPLECVKMEEETHEHFEETYEKLSESVNDIRRIIAPEFATSSPNISSNGTTFLSQNLSPINKISTKSISNNSSSCILNKAFVNISNSTDLSHISNNKQNQNKKELLRKVDNKGKSIYKKPKYVPKHIYKELLKLTAKDVTLNYVEQKLKNGMIEIADDENVHRKRYYKSMSESELKNLVNKANMNVDRLLNSKSNTNFEIIYKKSHRKQKETEETVTRSIEFLDANKEYQTKESINVSCKIDLCETTKESTEELQDSDQASSLNKGALVADKESLGGSDVMLVDNIDNSSFISFQNHILPCNNLQSSVTHDKYPEKAKYLTPKKSQIIENCLPAETKSSEKSKVSRNNDISANDYTKIMERLEVTDTMVTPRKVEPVKKPTSEVVQNPKVSSIPASPITENCLTTETKSSEKSEILRNNDFSANEFSTTLTRFQIQDYTKIMEMLEITNAMVPPRKVEAFKNPTSEAVQNPKVSPIPASDTMISDSMYDIKSSLDFFSACSGEGMTQNRKEEVPPSQSMFSSLKKDEASKNGYKLENPLSAEELQYLCEGFKIYGTNFKEILAKYPFKENRTANDLYLKYRNDIIKENNKNNNMTFF